MRDHKNFRLRSWLWPAVLALVLFLGNIAANLAAADLESVLRPYRVWIWLLIGLAAAVSVWLFYRDYHAERGAPADHPAETVDAVLDLQTRYLQRVVRDAQFLNLRGLDFRMADANTGAEERRRLIDIYIDLETTTQLREGELGAMGIEDARERDAKPLTALEALVRQPHLVLLGEPGGGKTTFVNHLIFCLAQHGLAPREDTIDRLHDWPAAWADLLPVPLVLRDVAAWLLHEWVAIGRPTQRRAALFDVYLAHWLAENGLGAYHDVLTTRLRQGRGLLLLDGLDEVPLTDEALARFKEMIDDLPAAFPAAPILVTCRVLSYQDPRWRLARTWPTAELAPLSDEKIEGFISAWYQQLADVQSLSSPETLSADLQRAVQQSDLQQLARNPLLLTVMAVVHAHAGRLPTARAKLYEEVVNLLLFRWDDVKIERQAGRATTLRELMQQVEIGDNDLKGVLQELAFETHRQSVAAGEDGGRETADIGEAALNKALRRLDPAESRDWANAMVQAMKLRAGLLVERLPEVYAFPHRTFQEYLAGCFLSKQGDFTEQTTALAAEGVFWHEVILLAVGRLVHVNEEVDRPLGLVGELCPTDAPAQDDDTAWRNVWLAGRVLLEIGVARTRRRDLGTALMARTRTRLTTLITTDRLTPRARAEAGSVLSALEDPRDLGEMVAVPAGAFRMGSDPEEEREYIEALYKALVDAKITEDAARAIAEASVPQHTLTLPAFQIAKYPVTNAQYAEFVAATNHDAPQHWRGRTPPVALRNHPVVSVSWHDAVAYCVWRSQVMGVTVRLPTEAEWEKASRGEDGRIFPWGNTFDPEFCNVRNTGIGDTSPVGIFAQGASPYVCHDMAGNVWEWTSSLYQVYPYKADDGREDLRANGARTLRGGSFASGEFSVRCARRNDGDPDLRLVHFGFRVVVVSLSPGG